LLILVLHRLPLLVGDHLPLRVGAVLADHHERREEDRLERDDHCQQPERILLHTEADPQSKPDDVDVDERHRSRERRDPVGDAVLYVLGALFGVLHQRRVDRCRKRPRNEPVRQSPGV
jgi:hypothetical protein